MTEVFKTNVQKVRESAFLVSLLREYFPDSRINFDLEDCDRILRVEGVNICPKKITELVTEKGYVCQQL